MRYKNTRQFREYGILLARIDDRLVHGQVVAGWNRVLSAGNIIVSSDSVAADEFRKIMLENASAPGDISVAVYGSMEAARRTKSGEYRDKGAILLFESPAEVLRFLGFCDCLD
jgi:mannose/fructose/N-acetylgalactosamine-specific phosphotransferase system component IIB